MERLGPDLFHDVEHVGDAVDIAYALAARLDSVLALHYRLPGSDICGECVAANGNGGPFVMWPCSTALATRSNVHSQTQGDDRG